jgi:diguanylate cyclase (GGDEF)-like protein
VEVACGKGSVGDEHALNPEEGLDVKDRPHTSAAASEMESVDEAFGRARREVWLTRVTAAVVVVVLALWAVRGEDVSPPAARYASGIALSVIALGLAVLMAMRAGHSRMLAERAYLIELHQATNRARQQVFRDHLSGLYSRWFFYERLTEELTRCGRYGRLASVAFLCFPDWKGLTLDVQAYLIEQVGYLLQNDLRSSDVATRWGPGQFVWYLPETDVPGAMIVVRRLAESVVAAKAIVGAAQFPGDGTTLDELLRVAQTRAQHGEAAA